MVAILGFLEWACLHLKGSSIVEAPQNQTGLQKRLWVIWWSGAVHESKLFQLPIIMKKRIIEIEDYNNTIENLLLRSLFYLHYCYYVQDMLHITLPDYFTWKYSLHQSTATSLAEISSATNRKKHTDHFLREVNWWWSKNPGILQPCIWV